MFPYVSLPSHELSLDTTAASRRVSSTIRRRTGGRFELCRFNLDRHTAAEGNRFTVRFTRKRTRNRRSRRSTRSLSKGCGYNSAVFNDRDRWDRLLPHFGAGSAVAISVILVGALIGASFILSPAGDTSESTSPSAGYSAPTTPLKTEAVAPPQQRPADGPTKLFFVGTSITGGSAALNPSYSYPSLVQAAIEQGGAVERVTMPIRREPPGTPRNLYSYDVDAIPNGVNIGVIELVTNDINRSKIEDYRIRYPEFIKTFRERNPEATLVCVGGWTNPGGDGALYQTVARETCEEFGGSYAKIDSLFNDSRNRGPATNISTYEADNFHPNNLGSMRIAETIVDELPGYVPGSNE